MTKSNASVSLPESVSVEGYTVHKLKLSEYAIVLEKMEKIPELIAKIDGVETGQIDSNMIVRALPKILATALPEAIEILSLSVRVPVEELNEKMDLKTCVKCFKAMFQVNDFLGVWGEIEDVFKPKHQEKKSEL